MQLLEPAKTRRPLTVEQYMRLDLPDRTELLGGQIFDVSPRNEPHRLAVRALTESLVLGSARRFTVQVQDAAAVPDWQGKDAPEVDVAVLNRKAYGSGPTANDEAPPARWMNGRRSARAPNSPSVRERPHALEHEAAVAGSNFAAHASRNTLSGEPRDDCVCMTWRLSLMLVTRNASVT